jgi:hypothetical protein
MKNLQINEDKAKSTECRSISCVYFFVAYPWLIHHQLDLAFAHKFRALGMRVVIITCNQVQATQDTNSCEMVISKKDSDQFCRQCNSFSQATFSEFELHNLVLPSGGEESISSMLPSLADLSLEQVLGLKISGINFYTFAASTICTRFRISSVDVLESWRSELDLEVRVALRIWIALDARRLEYLSKNSVAFVFNGRFTPYRTAYEFFRSLGLSCYTHERGLLDDSYLILKNKKVTDSDAFLSREMLGRWRGVLSVDAVRKCCEQARIMISEKSIGKNTGYLSFAGELNISLLEKIRNRVELPALNNASYRGSVLFLTSTPDEVDPLTAMYGLESQITDLSRLSAELRAIGFSVVIRHHPNAGSKYNSKGPVVGYLNQAINSQDCFDLSFLPDDDIASNYLLDLCDISVAPFSSMCIEAAFKRKKCIIDINSIFACLFPARFLFNSTEGVKSLLAAIDSSPMTDEEYEGLLLGCYIYFYAETFRFSSFGIDKIFSPRTEVVSIKDAVHDDRQVSRIANSIVLDKRLDDLGIEDIDSLCSL